MCSLVLHRQRRWAYHGAPQKQVVRVPLPRDIEPSEGRSAAAPKHRNRELR